MDEAQLYVRHHRSADLVQLRLQAEALSVVCDMSRQQARALAGLLAGAVMYPRIYRTWVALGDLAQAEDQA